MLNNIEIFLRRNFAQLLRVIGESGIAVLLIGILFAMIPAAIFSAILDFAKSVCGS